jgi:hypothetical protein
LQHHVENLSDAESIEEPFEASESEYEESENFSSDDSDFEVPSKRRKISNKTDLGLNSVDAVGTSNVSESENELRVGTDTDDDSEMSDVTQHNVSSTHLPNAKNDLIGWDDVDEQFIHRMSISAECAPVILVDLNSGSSVVQIFLKLFPNSLLQYIAQCTNQRLQILERATGRKVAPTDAHEIMIVIGCYLTMAYNY